MSYGATAFEAYKEVAGTACEVAALQRVGDDGWELNQAVCGALLVRIAKYMLSICKLGHGEEHGETMFALTRCVTESAINLQFLLSKNDPRYFERFVEDGLRAERELYKQIIANVSHRGGEYLGIEQNMMQSIENVFQNSQLSLDDEPNHSVSLGSYESRLMHLGPPRPVYPAAAYRVPLNPRDLGRSSPIPPRPRRPEFPPQLRTRQDQGKTVHHTRNNRSPIRYQPTCQLTSSQTRSNPFKPI